MNGGTIENAQAIAAHDSPRTTKFYDRRNDQISLDEIERILIRKLPDARKYAIIGFANNYVQEITMLDAAVDTRNIHSLTDFLRNYKAHIAQLKETRIPEVLTVNGRAEVVILDTETYESIMKQLADQQEREIAAARAHMAKSLKNAPPQELITEAEMESRAAAMRELVAETERLGLYR